MFRFSRLLRAAGPARPRRRPRPGLESLEDRTLLSNYYVSPAGNDAGSGTSPDAPFRTIRKAINLAQPGDVVNLAPGDYYQDVATVRSGTPGQPITVTGPPTAVIHGGGAAHVFQENYNYITLQGFTLDGLFGDPNSASGYRDILLYAQGTGARSGVHDLRVLDMTFRHSGGEALRLRYFARNNEVAGCSFSDCGVYDFRFNGGGKNGEAIYLGTSSNQWADGKNPTADPDGSSNNWIHDNTFDTHGNECVDMKEGSHDNLVERNSCTGQMDPDSGGIDSRGDHNVIRDNDIFGNTGSGVRLGGHVVNGVQYGLNNDVYGNRIHDNKSGGIRFMATPQGRVSDNVMWNNTGGDAVGTYGSQYHPTTTTQPPTTPPPPTPSPQVLPVASVTASGSDGNVPANTLDGDLTTRWSALGDGQWIQYDLGSLHTVSAVNIAFYKGDQRIQRFDIRVSSDGVHWTTAYSGKSSGKTTALQRFDFPGVTGRYVRIVGHGNTQNKWNSLTEVSIVGV